MDIGVERRSDGIHRIHRTLTDSSGKVHVLFVWVFKTFHADDMDVGVEMRSDGIHRNRLFVYRLPFQACGSVMERESGDNDKFGLATRLPTTCTMRFDTMAGVLEDIDRSSRLIFVLKCIGDIFIRMLGLASVIEDFVLGKSATEDVDKKDCSEDKVINSGFVTETQNLLHFHSSLLKSDRELFRDFHDFSLNCGKHIATVLRSSGEICRKCGKKLALEKKVIPV